MEWSPQQVDALTDAAHRHPAPHVRVKALAIRAVALGQSQADAAALCATSRQSVGAWVRRFRQGGVEALAIAPGRGRKRQVDDKQLEQYALQGPRNFGIDRSRWTLRLLAQTVPCLSGMSDSGVLAALRRCGFSYKRGQPWMLSPDPQYEKKRLVISAALEQARRYPGRVVALFQDEASFYRQPSQGWLWAWAGRRQPRMGWSHRSNTLVRIAGWVDAVTGATGVLQAARINVTKLLASYRELLDRYPQALMVYLIQDNWPVHTHPRVRQFLAEHPRLVLLLLPTYAPWLNPVEKLWRWVRQRLCHAHPFCDDFNRFKTQLEACFAQAATDPAVIRRYCGLDTAKIFSA